MLRMLARIFALAVSVQCHLSAAAEAGQRLYLQNCAVCHGDLGAGDGPASDTTSLALRDLRTISARNGGQFPETLIARIIDGRDGPEPHLRGGMPVWGEVFAARNQDSDQIIGELLKYLRSIQIESTDNPPPPASPASVP